MPKVTWTKEQQSAIYEKGSNILVAAAAGSGKTAVLVERIINKIVNENVDIDKLLVVTFTNAAASEMRERILDAIYKKIEEKPEDARLQKQINLLNKASICTIHSFCLEVIRNYFYELDLSANFRIADSAEIELLKQDVLEELFEEKYYENDEEFITLINIYTSYRGDEPLKELVLKIYEYIQSAPFPKAWLEEKIQMFNLKDELQEKIDYAKTIWGEILLEEYKNKILENKLKLEGVKYKLAKFPELEKFTCAILNDIEMLKDIEAVISKTKQNIWNTIYIKANELKFGKWPTDKKCTIDLKNEAKEIRDKVKKDIEAIHKKIFIYDSENAAKDIYAMYDNLKRIGNIVNEFEEKFSQSKKEKNIIDFHDIEHFALKILVKQNENEEYVPSEVAKKIMEKYTEIAIDEYQDSNLVQEYILKVVSNGNNTFMVGDVKQSIYKFRQARPELFLEKYEKYELVEENTQIENNTKYENTVGESINCSTFKEIPQETSQNKIGKKIKLFKNFRSRENILKITNLIFDQIMSKKLGDIDYTKEEYLNLGANYENPPEGSKFAGKAELHIIDMAKRGEEEAQYNVSQVTNSQPVEENCQEKKYVSIDKSEEEYTNNEEESQEEPIENVLIEAKFVAHKIQELLNSNYMVYDKKKGYRKITYKDIVILLRATSNMAPIYEKELSELNIPVFSDSSSKSLEQVEIQTIMSVLKIINNPLQDIALITVLRSSIANFTDNDLVQIRLADKSESFYNAMLKARVSVETSLKQKITNFINMLEKWKSMEEYNTLDELIWQIYQDSNYYNYVGLLNNGKLRQANLKMLFEKARQYEGASFKGLYNFINFIEKIKTNNKDMGAAKIIGENENVVRIMSIHKSKGLEFPVVFLSGTSKKFNQRDLNDNILMHQDLGFGPKYINYERRIEYNTLAKEALKIKLKTESLSEEMRILYVALTRAKEKLYITGIEKDFKKSIKEKEELIQIYNGNKLNRNLIKKYKSYLDWIELVYLNCKEEIKDLLQIYEHNYKEFISNEKEEEQQVDLIELLKLEIRNKTIKDVTLGDLNTQIMNNEKLKNDVGETISCSQVKEMTKENSTIEIEKILNWKYKYKASENIPTKTSVSKIKQEKAKQKGIAEFLTQNETQKEISQTLSSPNFTKEETITGAQKGTLVHLCIKNLNETKQYNYEEIEKLIETLKNKKIITKKEAEAINVNQILEYTKSNLFKELKYAKEIHKEEPFYINIKAKEIYEEEIEENILVQGIIDLYYIDKEGKIKLVDYKTDYVQNENELILKYKEQLDLYKKALEQALNKKVNKVLIYSTYLKKEIEL